MPGSAHTAQQRPLLLPHLGRLAPERRSGAFHAEGPCNGSRRRPSGRTIAARARLSNPKDGAGGTAMPPGLSILGALCVQRIGASACVSWPATRNRTTRLPAGLGDTTSTLCRRHPLRPSRRELVETLACRQDQPWAGQRSMHRRICSKDTATSSAVVSNVPEEGGQEIDASHVASSPGGRFELAADAGGFVAAESIEIENRPGRCRTGASGWQWILRGKRLPEGLGVGGELRPGIQLHLRNCAEPAYATPRSVGAGGMAASRVAPQSSMGPLTWTGVRISFFRRRP